MRKSEIKTVLLAAVCTLAIFLFIGVSFIAVNNTQKNLNGNGFAVMRSSNGFVVEWNKSRYLVDMQLSSMLNPLLQIRNVVTSVPLPFSSNMWIEHMNEIVENKSTN